jgi:hypothetical protein
MFRIMAVFAFLELLVTAVTYFSSDYQKILFHIDVWYSLLVVTLVLLVRLLPALQLPAFLACVGELILVSLAVGLHGYQGVQLLDLFFSAALTALSLARLGVGKLWSLAR